MATREKSPHVVKQDKESGAFVINGNTNVSLGDFDSNARIALANLGLRTLIRRFLGANAPTADAAPEAIKGMIEAVQSGDAFKRGKTAGAAIEHFINVLVALGMTNAKDVVEANKANLAPEVFATWVGTIRRADEYKAKYAEMYPRQPKTRKPKAKKSLSELLSTVPTPKAA